MPNAEQHRIFTSMSWKLIRSLGFFQRKLVREPYDFVRRAYQRRLTPGAPRHASISVAADAAEKKAPGSEHKVLLVLHEFSRSGAPRAVLYLARALFLLHGVRPVIIAPIDGPIRAELEDEGFEAIVDPLLFNHHASSSELTDFVSGFERVIVTPLASFPFVRYSRKAAKHLTWWIHEEAKGFEYIADNFSSDLASLFDSCDSVWLGSPLCFLPASQYAPTAKLRSLLYGCEDISIPDRPHESERMVFTIIGSVEPRKGQDIFLNAVSQLPAELRRKAIFRIVGSPYNDWSANFHEKICAQARLIPEVECIPNVSFQQLREIYSETDVVVSASRADPMPISITDGLMFSKVCLFSSPVGHAQLLKDGKDCLIFANESAEALAEKMAWLIRNPTNLTILGAAGRQVYERHFSMNGFINNVRSLLNEKN